MSNLSLSEKLKHLLAIVQKQSDNEDFIYGVTSREGRGTFTRIKDFFIDRSSVPVQQKAYFFELLGTMLRAGISLNKVLLILSKKTENMRLRRIIATLSYELEHGRPLSAALNRFPDVFDQSERGAIRSAEAVGHLEQMLFKIAANLERRVTLNMRLKSALIYPVVVLASLVIAGTVMIVFVVPRMRELFAGSTVDLPLITKILLNGSTFLSEFWWFFAILIIFGAVVFHTYSNSENGKLDWDFRKLKFAFIGPILRKIYVLRFVDTLGILLESGLPIGQCLECTAEAIGNEVYRLKTFEALGAVTEGRKLSSSLAESPFLFPETVVNMIAIGEQAASLSDISQKIGAHFEREIDHTLKNMTTVLGPLLILLIGASVAFFALAIMTPIFSLTQSLS